MSLSRASVVAAVMTLVSCASNRAPFRELDVTSGRAFSGKDEPLGEHALRGALIRDAIERGDLKATNEAASALIDFVTKYEKPTPGSRLDAMVESARTVAVAQDLHSAAMAYAMVSERCGECHAQIGGPASVRAAAPRESLGVVAAMRRHHWGAARLGEGLVAPSDEAWLSGAEVLSAAAVRPELAQERSASDVEALAKSVQALGLEAANAPRAAARIAIYGELISTCASCHSRVRGAR